mgnify:CR=1 FL=1|tara:strand:+ start:113076 stop:114581 length:1506 start_codon:yes stop_codon:yes gene_type:complete
MGREEVLSKLTIRLSHLVDTADPQLHADLEKVRKSLRGEINESELRRISDRLAKQLLQNENAQSSGPVSIDGFASEFATSIKAIEVDKSHRKDLARLADELAKTKRLETQLETLKEVFQVLKAAHSSAPKKKSSGGGLLGFLDKKGEEDDGQLQLFLEKSARLIDQAIKHIDVLNGNSKNTKGLREQLEQPASVELMGEALEDVIRLLREHSQRISEERITTQNFLGDLRERLSSVEEVILTVLNDGDESLERAVSLEQEVGEDVRVIGDAVNEDDLDTLKKTVESGLSKLTSKLSDYLEVERDNHRQSKEKVEDLNKKIRDMEDQARDLRGQIKAKQDLAFKDPLTGVYNRAGFEERVAEEFARSQRSNAPLSLVFVDCNKFKQINDTFGHAAGDTVLMEVAAALATRARTSDIVARYGGDEFVAVLPDTEVEGATHFAKDACQRILKAGFNANGKPLDVSISCGITQRRENDTPETALQRADEAMYKAKKVDGEKVVVA